MRTFMYQVMCKLVQHDFEPNVSRLKPSLSSSTAATTALYLKAQEPAFHSYSSQLFDAHGVVLTKLLDTVMCTGRKF
jgi:hypothetical protein